MERREFNGPISPSQDNVEYDFGDIVKATKYAFSIDTDERVVEVKAGCFCTNTHIQNSTSSAVITGTIKMPSSKITPFDVLKHITLHWENGGTTKVTFKATLHDSQDSIQAFGKDNGGGGTNSPNKDSIG